MLIFTDTLCMRVSENVVLYSIRIEVGLYYLCENQPNRVHIIFHQVHVCVRVTRTPAPLLLDRPVQGILPSANTFCLCFSTWAAEFRQLTVGLFSVYGRKDIADGVRCFRQKIYKCSFNRKLKLVSLLFTVNTKQVN